MEAGAAPEVALDANQAAARDALRCWDNYRPDSRRNKRRGPSTASRRLPGEDWDSAAFSYRSPPKKYDAAGEAALPGDLKNGEYILALAILDRQGGRELDMSDSTLRSKVIRL